MSVYGEETLKHGFVLVGILGEGNVGSDEIDKVSAFWVLVVLDDSTDGSNHVFFSVFLLGCVVNVFETDENVIKMLLDLGLCVFQ